METYSPRRTTDSDTQKRRAEQIRQMADAVIRARELTTLVRVDAAGNWIQ